MAIEGTDRRSRRRFLGGVGAAGLIALGGCLGTQQSGSNPIDHPGTLDTEFHTNVAVPADETVTDGFPPAYHEGEPADPSARLSTIQTNGESVTLAPIGLAYDWHRTSAARFVDARGVDQYKRAHIYGAVSSPAVQNSQGGGIEDWPAADRIVCYCGCPHHLSSIRAAGLQKAGFTDVYVIDEGFGQWQSRDYPMRGTTFESPQARILTGRVPARHAGAYVWAIDPDSGQREATRIGTDGRYSLELRFGDVDDETPIRVTTPTGSVTDTLAALERGTVTE